MFLINRQKSSGSCPQSLPSKVILERGSMRWTPKDMCTARTCMQSGPQNHGCWPRRPDLTCLRQSTFSGSMSEPGGEQQYGRSPWPWLPPPPVLTKFFVPHLTRDNSMVFRIWPDANRVDKVFSSASASGPAKWSHMLLSSAAKESVGVSSLLFRFLRPYCPNSNIRTSQWYKTYLEWPFGYPRWLLWWYRVGRRVVGQHLLRSI